MNFLVDTHVLIWSIGSSEKLSVKVKHVLEDPNNNIFVSAISFWEISLKYALGKFPLNGLTPDDLPKLSTEIGFKLIPLSPVDGATFHQFNINGHRDPFDRILMWQAVRQGMTLISKDRNIALFADSGLKVLW